MKVFVASALVCCFFAYPTAAAAVKAHRAPNGGIQPQAVVDPSGTLHIIYFRGDQAGGDIYYVKRERAAESYSPETRVNSRLGSAISAGSIRGAQLAVGKNNRVHVVWNGGRGATKVTIAGKPETPLLYTRSTSSGQYEPERNLLTTTGELDGGSSVAADPLGNVYVTWHGSTPGNKRGEAGRAVYMTRSANEGETFSPEASISPRDGVCACCGMRAFVDDTGAVYVTYRSMANGLDRNESFLVSPKPGAPFKQVDSHPWRVATCPMSSTTLTPATGGALAAWESDGQVFFATIDRHTMRMASPVAPPKGPKRKHPVAVRNQGGETLLAWTEGTAWAKGGSVHWQLFDPNGKPVGDPGRAEGLPVWGLPTAFVDAKGEFEVIY